MRSFLSKIIGFTTLIVVLLVGINLGFQNSNSHDHAWGNPLFRLKVKDSQSHQSINTFFLGSSHFYRHIDPILFDSLSANTQSYNLSVQGLATPENYYLFEKLLEDEDFRPQNVFLTLSSLQATAPENFYTDRSVYFLDRSQVFNAINIIIGENHTLVTKAFRISSVVSNFVYRTLGLPALRNSLKGTVQPKNTQFSERKGFLSLDDEISEENKNRRIHFEKNYQKLDQRRKNALAQFSAEHKKTPINQAHLIKAQQLLKVADKKGIQLFYIITPRRKTYQGVIPLLSKLPKNRIINLANPEFHPEFYEVDNSFDIGHLNKKGAKIFTERLVEEYLKIKSK